MPKDPRAYRKHLLKLRGGTVTLSIGEQLQRQTVHEELLCRDSEVFAAALKKEWQEGQERLIPLPTDRPEVVDLYVHWLYTGKIFTRPLTEEIEEGNEECTLLVQLFVFGEKMQNGNLKDATIDALIVATNTKDGDGKLCFPTDTVSDAYDGTPASSPLRRLYVDMYVSHGRRQWIKGAEHPEFLADLSRALIDGRRDLHDPDPTGLKVSSCQYHHHTRDVQCYAANGV